MFKLRNIIVFNMLLASIVFIVCANPTDRPCNCVWIDVWEPVCGTDGITYTNIMKLKCINECQGKNIGVAYPGECGAY